MHIYPALYMWFLQARCGLLFTIINHNHTQSINIGVYGHISHRIDVVAMTFYKKTREMQNNVSAKESGIMSPTE